MVVTMRKRNISHDCKTQLWNNKHPLNVNDVLVYEKIHNADEVNEMNKQQRQRTEITLRQGS